MSVGAKYTSQESIICSQTYRKHEKVTKKRPILFFRRYRVVSSGRAPAGEAACGGPCVARQLPVMIPRILKVEVQVSAETMASEPAEIDRPAVRTVLVCGGYILVIATSDCKLSNLERASVGNFNLRAASMGILNPGRAFVDTSNCQRHERTGSTYRGKVGGPNKEATIQASKHNTSILFSCQAKHVILVRFV